MNASAGNFEPLAAVQAIRDLVQNNDSPETKIGEPAYIAGIAWFGRKMGWVWPTSYLVILGKHDGFLVDDTWLFGFQQSFQVFLIFAEKWESGPAYWPVSGDGCGSYWVLALEQRDESGECPVVFLDHESDYTVVDSYPNLTELVVNKLAQPIKPSRKLFP